MFVIIFTVLSLPLLEHPQHLFRVFIHVMCMIFAIIYFSKHYIKTIQSPSIQRCYSSLPAGGSGDPGGRSAAAQTAAPSASLWFSSSCQMMELESGTFSASGIPEPVTATLAGPGSWT